MNSVSSYCFSCKLHPGWTCYLWTSATVSGYISTAMVHSNTTQCQQVQWLLAKRSFLISAFILKCLLVKHTCMSFNLFSHWVSICVCFFFLLLECTLAVNEYKYIQYIFFLCQIEFFLEESFMQRLTQNYFVYKMAHWFVESWSLKVARQRGLISLVSIDKRLSKRDLSEVSCQQWLENCVV